MAKHNIEAPAGVEIASMRKEQERVWDMLGPGPGTPWEDRGAIGVVKALFKTIAMSMTAPGKLLWSIRRPETPGDARVFAIICGFFFAIGWVLHDYLDFRAGKEEFDFYSHGYAMIVHFALGLGGTWVLLLLITRLFYKLVAAAEMRHKFPPVLAFNVYAYCLGPSILALMPYKFLGATVALVWIFVLFIYAAKTRLAIKTSGAVICNFIAAGGLFGLAAAAYFILRYVYGYLYGPDVPPAPPGR